VDFLFDEKSTSDSLRAFYEVMGAITIEFGYLFVNQLLTYNLFSLEFVD
jgi:hypothetical protein